MIYVRTDPPAEAPIALELLKKHLRIEPDDTGEDDLVEFYLAAVVAHLDGWDAALKRCLVAQGWAGYADRPGPIDTSLYQAHRHGVGLVYGPIGFMIELGPVQIGDETPIAVSYRSAGAWVDVDPAVFVALPISRDRAILALAPGRAWPAADEVVNAWRVTFTAGTAADEVPASVKAALLLLTSDLYGNRDGKTLANLVANPTIERLLEPVELPRV